MTDERGFTLIEVLVSALVLCVGVLGLMTAVESALHLSRRSQGTEQAAVYAEREIERIAARAGSTPGWATLGLTRAPAPAADPGSPLAAVTGHGTLLVPRDPRDPGGSVASGVDAGGEPFVTVAAGGLDPGPEAFDVGGTTGQLYRFVTRVDPCTVADGARKCPPDGTEDTLRRLTVAVVVTRGGDSRDGRAVWTSTLVANPAAHPLVLR